MTSSDMRIGPDERSAGRRAHSAAVCCAAVMFLACGSSARAAGTPAHSLAARVQTARDSLLSKFALVSGAMGDNGAANLVARFDSDLAGLTSDLRPEGYPVADWNERLTNVVDLDTSILSQALDGVPHALSTAPGLTEHLITARSDGTLQPFALYVPPSIGDHPTLVVLLHGRPQTESELLSSPYFRTLADSTGTIVVAPFGRGNYDYAGPASDEVYQVADLVASAFHVDARHVFLAGYSMGGFSVFDVGPTHATRWAAIMCVSGSLVNSDAAAVIRSFQQKPVYVVTGKNDDSIPARYGELTASYLFVAGVPTEFREQPDGTHMLRSLVPSLTLAWNDMIGGIVRSSPELIAGSLPLFLLPRTGDDAKKPT